MVGKVFKIISGLYYVHFGDQIYLAKPLGIFRHKKIDVLVGDEVEFDLAGSITKVLPRRNQLARPKVANIDQVILVVALTAPRLSVEQVFKMLAVIESQQMIPLLVFTKVDIAPAQTELKATFADYEMIIINALEKLPSKLISMLRNKLSVVTGDSGVGKSTIIQQLVSSDVLVGTISVSSQRGKHTTRVTEIAPLKTAIGPGAIIDTPGFSAISLALNAQALASAFTIFRERLHLCRFTYCLHDKEPEVDCQIKRDVASGLISVAKYTNYLKLLKEINSEKSSSSVHPWPKRQGHPRNKAR